MTQQRRQFSGAFKAKVALEALKEQKTLSEIAHEHGIHPGMVGLWKKQLMEQLPSLFENPSPPKSDQKEKDELYKQIGQLKVENDFLKKKSAQFNG